MFYRDLKQIYFVKKIIPTAGSYSLIIGLSNGMFFHTFYHHLTKISEIETAVIGPKHRSGGPSKTKIMNYFFRKKIIVNQCLLLILHQNQNLELKYRNVFFSHKCLLSSIVIELS